MNINQYLKEKGYVDDAKEYLKHNDFFSYTDYCNKNSLIPVSRNIFMNNLKTKIDKDIAQKFINMLSNQIIPEGNDLLNKFNTSGKFISQEIRRK